MPCLIWSRFTFLPYTISYQYYGLETVSQRNTISMATRGLVLTP